MPEPRYDYRDSTGMGERDRKTETETERETGNSPGIIRATTKNENNILIFIKRKEGKSSIIHQYIVITSAPPPHLESVITLPVYAVSYLTLPIDGKIKPKF